MKVFKRSIVLIIVIAGVFPSCKKEVEIQTSDVKEIIFVKEYKAVPSLFILEPYSKEGDTCTYFFDNNLDGIFDEKGKAIIYLFREYKTAKYLLKFRVDYSVKSSEDIDFENFEDLIFSYSSEKIITKEAHLHYLYASLGIYETCLSIDQ